MIDGKLFLVGRTTSSGAATWLRLEQHMNAMVRDEVAHCVVFGEEEDGKQEAYEALLIADAIICHAFPYFERMELMESWIDAGKAVIWDIDDDPENVSPYNPSYLAFGLHSVQLETPIKGQKWLWKDGHEGFSVRLNEERHDRFMVLLEKCAAISTTTHYLARKLRKRFPNTQIIIRPNVLDFDEVWTLTRRARKDGQIRIMYQGGSSHYQDIDTILPVLGTIARDYPHVRFLFCGDTKAHSERYIPADRIEEWKWVPHYPSFVKQQALLSPDIALAPLCMDGHHAEFNRCKSELKWLDAAGIGVPCLCTWDYPYAPAVKFGEHIPWEEWTGVLCDTANSWYMALCNLIEDRSKRLRIGFNAYCAARSTWNVSTYTQRYADEYLEAIRGYHNAHHAHP